MENYTDKTAQIYKTVPIQSKYKPILDKLVKDLSRSAMYSNRRKVNTIVDNNRRNHAI